MRPAAAKPQAAARRNRKRPNRRFRNRRRTSRRSRSRRRQRQSRGEETAGGEGTAAGEAAAAQRNRKRPLTRSRVRRARTASRRERHRLRRTAGCENRRLRKGHAAEQSPSEEPPSPKSRSRSSAGRRKTAAQGRPARRVARSRERPAAERPRPPRRAAKLAHSEKFAALGLSDIMLDALAAATYQEPTPVQEGFIPRALAGVDVMGQAQTGTGKTAAFAIPILEMLQPQRRGGPPQALVLVPTRELAVQVRDECEKLALGRNVSIVAVYGGKPIRKQIEQVNQGASFIVGTPGRVLDLMSRGALSVERAAGRRAWTRPIACSTSASGPTSRRSSAAARSRGRRCCSSATLAPPVKRLAERYMREPEVLDFSPKNLAVETIEQFYFTVDPERKFDLLVKLLEREDPAAGDHLLPHEARDRQDLHAAGAAFRSTSTRSTATCSNRPATA